MLKFVYKWQPYQLDTGNVAMITFQLNVKLCS